MSWELQQQAPGDYYHPPWEDKACRVAGRPARGHGGRHFFSQDSLLQRQCLSARAASYPRNLLVFDGSLGPQAPFFCVPMHVVVTVLCAFGHHCPQHPILVAGHIGLWQEPEPGT